MTLVDRELVVLHTTPSMSSKFSVHAWRQCGGLNKWRTFYNVSLWVKLIVASQEVLEWVWLSRNQNRLPFIQIQTLPPSMHHKWKELIDIVCKTTNGKFNSQRPIEFKDNSINHFKPMSSTACQGAKRLCQIFWKQIQNRTLYRVSQLWCKSLQCTTLAPV